VSVPNLGKNTSVLKNNYQLEFVQQHTEGLVVEICIGFCCICLTAICLYWSNILIEGRGVLCFAISHVRNHLYVIITHALHVTCQAPMC
jgi:hypothetical protein